MTILEETPTGAAMSTSANAYVLVTAAYNEEKYIEKTIESVIAQTILPKRWVIVSDCSTDRTDEIVRRYAQKYPFITLHRIEKDHPRNFRAQVLAINTGYERVKPLEFNFIGNLDADIAFQSRYFETLLDKFGYSENLGLAGGYIYERQNGSFKARPGNTTTSVPHAVQLFRRRCFEEIGGYSPLPYGGPDWLAEIMARKAGWTVESFTDLPVFHFRPTSSAGGIVRGRFRQGLLDHSIGSSFSFEFIKCLSRVRFRPYIIGSLARFAGYVWSLCRREPYAVSSDIVVYLRAEQRSRISQMIPSTKSKVIERLREACCLRPSSKGTN